MFLKERKESIVKKKETIMGGRKRKGLGRTFTISGVEVAGREIMEKEIT